MKTTLNFVFANFRIQVYSRMSFRRPPQDVERMTSLRVDNLPYRTHPEVPTWLYFLSFSTFISLHKQDLKPLFEKFGDVGDIYMPTERGTGRSRGFAFVRFYDKRDAEVLFVTFTNYFNEQLFIYLFLCKFTVSF